MAPFLRMRTVPRAPRCQGASWAATVSGMRTTQLTLRRWRRYLLADYLTRCRPIYTPPALRPELMSRPDIAMRAVAHTLAARVITHETPPFQRPTVCRARA
jgi:hypothetical protein